MSFISGTLEQPTPLFIHLTTYPRIPWQLFSSSFLISSIDQFGLIIIGNFKRLSKSNLPLLNFFCLIRRLFCGNA